MDAFKVVNFKGESGLIVVLTSNCEVFCKLTIVTRFLCRIWR